MSDKEALPPTKRILGLLP